MIGRLRGILAETGEEEMLIDCGGVGYVVRAGSRTLSRLPTPGDEVIVHVETRWSSEGSTMIWLPYVGRGFQLLICFQVSPLSSERKTPAS